jgi:hypothetical protein
VICELRGLAGERMDRKVEEVKEVKEEWKKKRKE